MCYAIRLGPGEEIKSSLLELVATNNLQAPFVISCVGSVQRAKLRLAHATAEDRNHVRAKLHLQQKHEYSYRS